LDPQLNRWANVVPNRFPAVAAIMITAAALLLPHNVAKGILDIAILALIAVLGIRLVGNSVTSYIWRADV
jgi:hypothetical protein